MHAPTCIISYKTTNVYLVRRHRHVPADPLRGNSQQTVVAHLMLVPDAEMGEGNFIDCCW